MVIMSNNSFILPITPPSSIYTQGYLLFSSYGMLVILPLSLLQKFFTLLVLFRMRKGIAKTTRLPFIMLSISDIFSLFLFFGVSIFGDYGLAYLSSGQLYVDIVNTNMVACKLLRSIGHFGIYFLNWIYFLMNVDRLLAIRTNHNLKHSSNVRNVMISIIIIFVLGIANSSFTAYVYRVQPSEVSKYGKTLCAADLTEHFAWLTLRILLAASTYVGPNVLSLLLALFLLLYLRQRMSLLRNRSHRLRQHRQVREFIIVEFCF